MLQTISIRDVTPVAHWMRRLASVPGVSHCLGSSLDVFVSAVSIRFCPGYYSTLSHQHHKHHHHHEHLTANLSTVDFIALPEGKCGWKNKSIAQLVCRLIGWYNC